MKSKQGLWYVRKQGRISGPFSSALITNHLTIGRLSMNDEISADKLYWSPVRNHPALHPLQDSEQALLAKRLLDERTGLDRRQLMQTAAAELGLREGERRAEEPESEAQRRELRRVLMQRYRQRRQRAFWPLLATFLTLLALALLAVLYPTILPVPLPNCSTPAGPGINWNNCLKPKLELVNIDLSHAQLRNSQMVGSNFMNSSFNGADIAYADLRFCNLSYSDLQATTLLGADLRKADLSYADLSNADLSYADLTDANLGGSKLANTRFDHSIWPNGQLCAIGSVGRCIAEKSVSQTQK